MKKLICMLLLAVLVLGLCGCSVPNTKDIFVGTWTCEANADLKLEASTVVLKDDFTADLTVGSESHTAVWALSESNPDAIIFTTVNDISYEDVEFPVLKGSLTIVDGMMQLSIYDGNAKDDDFTLVLLLDKQG